MSLKVLVHLYNSSLQQLFIS